jgi:hypothetical protein
MSTFPPHINKIMKLLLLSGRQNPNANEKAAAREKAENLMKQHGLTVDAMRKIYREWAGLPLPSRKSSSFRSDPVQFPQPDPSLFEAFSEVYRMNREQITVGLPFPGLRMHCKICGIYSLNWRALRGPREKFYGVVCQTCLSKLDPERSG